MSRSPHTRRDFLRKTAILGIGAATGALGCAAGLRTAQLTPKGEQIVVDTADYDELDTAGGAILITTMQSIDPIILVRTDENGYKAFLSACTHLGCQVRKTRFGFRCPCHGSAFDLNGQVLQGPANEPLIPYATETSGTVVTIEL